MSLKINIILLVSYFLGTLYIGYRAGKGDKSFKDVAIGGKWSTFSIIATTIATNIGAGALFKETGNIMKLGPVITIFALGRSIGYILKGYLFSGGLKEFRDCYSIADIMHKMYGKYARYLTAILTTITIIFSVVFATKFSSMLISKLLGVSTGIAAIISLIIVTFYTFFGGMKAVVATDKFQLVIMIFFFCIISYFTFINIGNPGEILSSYANLQASEGKSFFNFDAPGVAGYIGYFFVTAIFSYDIIDPACMKFLMMSAGEKQLQKSNIFSGFAHAFSKILVMFLGIVLLLTVGNKVPGDSVNLMFEFISKFIPPVLLPIITIGIVSIILSTTDSNIHAASVYFARDFISPFLRKPLSKRDFQISVLAISVIAFLLSFIKNNPLFNNSYSTMHSFVAPIILIPLFLGLRGFKNSPKDFWVNTAISLIVFFYCRRLTNSIAPYALFISLSTNFILFFIIRKFKNIPLFQKFINTNSLNFLKIFFPQNFFFLSIKSQYWVKKVPFSTFYIIVLFASLFSGAEMPLIKGTEYEFLTIKLISITLAATVISRDMWEHWQKKFFGPLWILTLFSCAFIGTYVFLTCGNNILTFAHFIACFAILFIFVDKYRASTIQFLGSLSAFIFAFSRNADLISLSPGAWATYAFFYLFLWWILTSYHRVEVDPIAAMEKTEDNFYFAYAQKIVSKISQSRIINKYKVIKPSSKIENIQEFLSKSSEQDYRIINSELENLKCLMIENEKDNLYSSIFLDSLSLQNIAQIIYSLQEKFDLSLSVFTKTQIDKFKIDKNIVSIFLQTFIKQYIKEQVEKDWPDKSLNILIDNAQISYIYKKNKAYHAKTSGISISILEASFSDPYYEKELKNNTFTIDILDREYDDIDSTSQEKSFLKTLIKEQYGTLIESKDSDGELLIKMVLPIDVSKIRPTNLDLEYPKKEHNYNYPEATKLEEKTIKDIKFRAVFCSLDKVKTAIDVIKTFHAHQTRKSGEPYYMHPLSVCSILLDMIVYKPSKVYEILQRQQESAVLAALLHDILEDTAFSVSSIILLFNSTVAHFVKEVTKIDYTERARIISNEDAFSKLINQDPIPICIKIADRIHNLQTIKGHPSIKKQKDVAEETLKFFIAPAEKLGLTKFAEIMKNLAMDILNEK